MVLWTVEPLEIQKLCLLIGLISATIGYLIGSHSQAEVKNFFNKCLPEEEKT
jgi:hypothetical protein